MVPYSPSPPLRRWLGARREPVRVLVDAHALCAGDVRPLAHAYAVRVVAEFQGFVRELHEHTAERLVALAGPAAWSRTPLMAAATRGRALDKGGASLRNVVEDFARLGLTNLSARLARLEPEWSGDGRRGDHDRFVDLLAVRNGIAHSREDWPAHLRHADAMDSLTWMRQQVPALDRFARALDRIAWEHLMTLSTMEPW